MIISLIKFIIIFFIAPYFVGILFSNNSVDQDINGIQYIIYYYILGFLSLLSIFELLCVPMSILKVDLHVLLITFSVFIAILLLLSIVLIFKKKIRLFISPNKINFNSCEIILLLLSIIIIAIQLFFVVYYQSNWMSGDDWDYVTRTSASLYTDKIVTMGAEISILKIIPKKSFCSWEIYIAWLCKISGINVPTMVHTVLNVSLASVVFAVFYLLGCELFEKYEDRFIFLSTISFANIFGLYSHYSLTFRWLMTMWQGKAVFMALVFQFLFVFLLHVLKEEYNHKYLIIYIIISLASCALTPTGVGMFLGTMFVSTVLIIINKRKIWYLRYFVGSVMFPAIYLIGYLCFN